MNHGHDTDFSKLVKLCPVKKISLISSPDTYIHTQYVCVCVCVYMYMCICIYVCIYMDISYLSLLSALGVVGALFWCFCSWLGAGKCWLGISDSNDKISFN